MRPQPGRRCCQIVVIAILMGVAAGVANADPLTIPGYTVTDLGAGTPTFSTDANGNGLLNAPSGQVFAFSQTTDTNAGPALMSTIPLLSGYSQSTYAGYQFPNNVWSYDGAATMNSNGLVAGTFVAGVGDKFYTDQGFYVQHNADGSWGQPMSFYQGNSQPAAGQVLFDFSIVGLTNTNQILFNTNSNVAGGTGAEVFNINTHTLTNLVPLLDNIGIIQPMALAIDNNGQVVVSSYVWSSSGDQLMSYLLTPDGVSSAPLEVPAPEPGTLAVMLLAIAGFAAHRLRERQSTWLTQEILATVAQLLHWYESCRNLFLPNRDKRAIMVQDSVD